MTTDMLIRADHPTAEPAFGDLYAQVQQFYSHQMQLFDAHDAERWAATFTEDAVFDVPTLDEPVRGRADLAANVLRNKAQQEHGGRQLRHWIGMLDVRSRRDDELRTRCYALVYVTERGGSSKLLRVCVMEDVLVRARGTWLTRHRVVTRDDLA
ncbi:nuclear transport factor 2 family protein [Streptomyces sp. ALI-76-A]|jgi:actinorhodin biosynthesis protein ActVIA|uniref:nuclear transport factor 2 family protein n=1 Tax=Streptomyces sp. ALI-76-A TaxID=3025736 RepID=UPI00256F62F2|nr:nuclear transport factor 2 family protein [Streptomyces sp. ALI-76-A]MDL5205398.1 nuclear transport factor 2 family protein [Streptomyces sp. ALI-76-A]